MGTRREGRELALKLLYREEVTGLADLAIPDQCEDGDEAGGHLTDEARGFGVSLVEGVRCHQAEIDAAIAGASEHWALERMVAVDKAVLRIGVYELMFEQGTPVGVVINEAVDCARKYSSDDCGRFVNGVLDRIARETRKPPDSEP
jgi:N utilization substance protein B